MIFRSGPHPFAASLNCGKRLYRMTTHARLRSLISALCMSAGPILIALFLLVGCGTTTTSPNMGTGSNTGSAFVVGTDAPVAGVVSFTTTIQSIDAIDANGNSVSLLSGTPTVDFARYNPGGLAPSAFARLMSSASCWSRRAAAWNRKG